MEKIVLIGGRIDGHAGVIMDVLEINGEYEIVGIVDNTPELQGKKINGIPVIGSSDDLDAFEWPADNVHIAIGDNKARGDLFRVTQNMGLNNITIVSPTAIISPAAKIGKGCFIGHRAIINNGAIINDAAIINTGAIIEHDNRIGYAAHVAPGTITAGRVRIDKYSFMGIGSTILPDISIGFGVMVGAGSVVVKNVPPNMTMIGYAAKEHNRNVYEDVEPDVSHSNAVYVAQPTLPEYAAIDVKFRDIFNSRMLSNFSKYSSELEVKIQALTTTKGVLTFPNATSALMLALKMMDLSGEVILPSFTFSATGHAVLWNGLTPVFADIDPKTFNLDPDDVEKKINDRTSAIIGVHIFGNPCNVERLESIAAKHGIKLIFDSAHALGSRRNGVVIGSYGDIECFSLSGTKVITSAEGGIVTSNKAQLIERMRLGRNYGAGDDYNCHYLGMNGKMSEFHAAIAIESLSLLDSSIRNRNRLVSIYQSRLSEIPGIYFQHIAESDLSTYKDFGIIINEHEFGMNRDKLIAKLRKKGIHTKRYFYPPLHEMPVYKGFRVKNLKHTKYVADNIICLPIYSHMKIDTVEKICYTIYRIWRDKGAQKDV